jgi:cytochrome c oxidase cbb3-type subunit 4
MKVDHNTLVAFAKSWGLFYLIAFAIVVLVYVFRPKNWTKFEDAKKSILEDKDDTPWQE